MNLQRLLSFITLFILSSLAGNASGADEQPSASPTSTPNIVLIVADDMGYGDFGANVGKPERMPEMNQLAAAGMRFTSFYANGPVCSPTRAALFSGRYQQHTGVDGVIKAAGPRTNGVDPKQFDSFATVLRDQGYATALFGKWHIGYHPRFNPVRHGFDEFRGFVSGNVDYFAHVDQAGRADWWQQDQLKDEPGYVTHLIRDHGNRFIRANKDNPFLLVLAHEAPHYPMQGPDDEPFREVGKKQGRLKLASDELQRRRNAMLASLDESLASLRSTLRECKLEENTLIVFCSDNGPETTGDPGPLRGRKGSAYEGGVRVPAFAYWKGHIQPGQVVDVPCITIDFFPTFLHLARVKTQPRQELDGMNLAPLLKGDRSTLAERALYWRYKDYRAIREGDWKWICEGEKEALFDLSADLGEQNNVFLPILRRPSILRSSLQTGKLNLTRANKAPILSRVTVFSVSSALLVSRKPAHPNGTAAYRA